MNIELTSGCFYLRIDVEYNSEVLCTIYVRNRGDISVYFWRREVGGQVGGSGYFVFCGTF